MLNGHDREQLVEVAIGECRCSGTPRPSPIHPDGDLVYLRPKPDLLMALAAQSALGQAGDYAGDNNAAIYSAFIRYGVIAWNIVDANGPVKVTHEAILDRLEWLHGGKVVADKARELYQDRIFAPLPTAKSAPQRPSRKTASTSASPDSGSSTPNSPSPSSPSAPEAGT